MTIAARCLKHNIIACAECQFPLPNINKMENKTKKLEAIKKAYGEHWETVKEFVNTFDGICRRKREPQEKLKDSNDHFGTSHDYINYRPKYLSGIETNNGWFELPAKNLLPHGWYWVRVQHPKTLIEDIIPYHLKDGAGILPYAFGTHYQPITKPQSPIY